MLAKYIKYLLLLSLSLVLLHVGAHSDSDNGTIGSESHDCAICFALGILVTGAVVAYVFKVIKRTVVSVTTYEFVLIRSFKFIHFSSRAPPAHSY